MSFFSKLFQWLSKAKQDVPSNRQSTPVQESSSVKYPCSNSSCRKTMILWGSEIARKAYSCPYCHQEGIIVEELLASAQKKRESELNKNFVPPQHISSRRTVAARPPLEIEPSAPSLADEIQASKARHMAELKNAGPPANKIKHKKNAFLRPKKRNGPIIYRGGGIESNRRRH